MMVYSVICDPAGDATRREFVETVETAPMAQDIVKHLEAHLPEADKVRSQWGGRPFDAKRAFDRSRWVEKQRDWQGEMPAPGKPLSL